MDLYAADVSPQATNNRGSTTQESDEPPSITKSEKPGSNEPAPTVSEHEAVLERLRAAERSIKEIQRVAEQGHASGDLVNPAILSLIKQTNLGEDKNALMKEKPASQHLSEDLNCPKLVKKKPASKAKAKADILLENTDFFCILKVSPS